MSGLRYSGFPPVVREDARVLLLGTLPGGDSLKFGQYYADPRNHFWALVGGVIGRNLAALSYAARLEGLAEAGVALWDVVESAEREGSLDKKLREVIPNDLMALVARLPELRAVGFTGKTAWKIGRKQFVTRPDLELVLLLSSSSALARPLSEKAAAWSVLTPFLRR